MQSLYWIAGLLAAVTGLVRSLLGERLIFRHLRQGTLVPTKAAMQLPERHIRILWATWHLGSVFGWGFAGPLVGPGLGHTAPLDLLVGAAVFAYLGGAILVFVGTKGRHPGWAALLLVALLTVLAARAV